MNIEDQNQETITWKKPKKLGKIGSVFNLFDKEPVLTNITHKSKTYKFILQKQVPIHF